jgi:hypothetical protein
MFCPSGTCKAQAAVETCLAKGAACSKTGASCCGGACAQGLCSPAQPAPAADTPPSPAPIAAPGVSIPSRPTAASPAAPKRAATGEVFTATPVEATTTAKGAPTPDEGAPARAKAPTVTAGGANKTADEATAPAEAAAAGLDGELEASPEEVEAVPEASPPASVKAKSSCVDHKWLVKMGYGPHELVHASGIATDVLCPGQSLPCGTEHHALTVAAVATSYGEYCSRPDVECARSVMLVNSLWTTHADAKAGIKVGPDAVVFMHDVRYPFAAQYVLHTTMRAMRTAKYAAAAVSGSHA